MGQTVRVFWYPTHVDATSGKEWNRVRVLAHGSKQKFTQPDTLLVVFRRKVCNGTDNAKLCHAITISGQL